MTAHRVGPGRLRVGAPLVVLLAVPLLVAPLAQPAVASGAGAPVEPVQLDQQDAEALLRTVVAALDRPHVGHVTVVSFTDAGPRVAALDVRVGAAGEVELRNPTHVLVGTGPASSVRGSGGAGALTPAAAVHGLDVEMVLAGWDARVGPPRMLDTGPATPVHLVRRAGAAIEEVLYVDAATGLPVRRETRGSDGAVLRVVAYTEITLVDMPRPGRVHGDAAAQDLRQRELLVADGYAVPTELGAGFTLLGAGMHRDAAAARYGDGLSVLSVYQQHGRLDPGELDGAQVRRVADRDVWTWPGREPVRLVWTGDDRTWTLVTDAPVEVVADAVASLPGETVGHDVPSRIRRGLHRAWSWATAWARG